MRPVDSDALDDDDDLRAYVAAFRHVEEPSSQARAATWTAIERATAPTRRYWLRIGAVIAAAAAVWIVLGTDAISLSLLAEGDTDARGDQAEYLPLDEAPELRAEERRPAPKAVVDAPAQPILETPTPTVEPTLPEVPAPSKTRPKTVRTRSLADETALFAEIQQALVDRRPARALEAVARHERDYPRGAFRLERTVAKAQALCAVGRTKSARRLRADFLAKHPSSHLAPRMKAVCPE
jgi:hypothetical protein